MSLQTYYVCSFGGCGSTLLCEYLSKFGKVKHIHSRLPPDKLMYVGNENAINKTYNEWFNDVLIPENNVQNYKVIYIYKNPIKAIYSRFVLKKIPHIQHLRHIQCDNNGFIRLMDVIDTKKDLYKIEEFFDNYTRPKERNYKIYCVKYEDFWDNIEVFNQIVGIPSMPDLYPKKKETIRNGVYDAVLQEIYQNLINKMNNKSFIEII